MMTALLVGVAVYTILGGMLSVLVTDFLQFVVMSAGLIVVTFLILGKVGWGTLVSTVQNSLRRGRIQSLPESEHGLVLRGVQRPAEHGGGPDLADADRPRPGGQRLRAPAARSIPGTSFFFVARFLIPGIWGIAALALLTPGAGRRNTLLAMPKMLGMIVPAGLMGLLIAAMLAADMCTDSSYMLTWGSVIYNDIMAPFRKTKWSEKKGPPLEPRHHRVHRRLPADLRPVVQAGGRPLDVPRHHGHDLSVQHVCFADRLLLLEACEQLGRRRRHLFRRDGAGEHAYSCRRTARGRNGSRPMTPLCGIATYVIVALAMIVGSFLKPQLATRGGRKSSYGNHRQWRDLHAERPLVLGRVTLVCLTWYSTITVYVAIKGAGDIQKMLRRLSDSQEQESR